MPRYAIPFEVNTSLVAGTPKTVAAVVAAGTRRAKLVGFELGFDSVTATDNACLIEIVRGNAATAGTSTTRTPVALDNAEPAALAAGRVNYSAEPTVLTVVSERRVTPVGGGVIYPIETADQPTCAVNHLLGIRLTAAQAQTNIRGTLYFDE
jgi:hypothetical protein